MLTRRPDRPTAARRLLLGAVPVAVVFALLPAPAIAAGFDVEGTAPNSTAEVGPGVDGPTSQSTTTVERTAVPAVATEPAKGDPSASLVAELPKTDTDDYRLVGVTWSPASTATGVAVEVRTLTDSAWSDWTALEVEVDESGEVGNPGTEPLWVGSAEGVAARVTSAAGTLRDVEISTIDPGTDEEEASVSASPASYQGPIDGVARATTTASSDGTPSFPSRPSIIRRSAWGASSGSYCSSPQVGSTTRGVVIHHTAGSNSYSASSSKALVRGIQAYHTKSRGWCDIGYNFLVDRYGQIFEGRKGGIDRNVRAAHSGNNAVNTYTTGISLMGNLDKVKPTSQMQASVVKLVGWRLGTTYLPAKGRYSLGGKSLNMIAGHRDVVGTGCPGSNGYAWLSQSGGLRNRVEAYLSKVNTSIQKRAAALGSAKTGAVFIGEYGSAGGRKTRFGSMDLYSKSGAGTRFVSAAGGFRSRYAAFGSQTSDLGFPTSDSPSVSSTAVTAQTFEHGSIYAVPSKGTFAIWDAADSLYRDLGGATGKLGAPTSSSSTSKTAFADGYIVTSDRGKTAVAYSASGKKLGSTSSTTPSPSLAKVGPLAGYSSTSAVAFSWSAVSGATSYEVCLMTATYAKSCLKTATITGLRARFANLKPTAWTDYVGKVRARNGSAVGAWSDMRGVDLKTPKLAKVGPLAGYSSTSAVAFSWSAVSGATSYEVCLMTATYAKSCLKTATITGLRARFANLKPTAWTDYVGKVRARNGSVVGAWSDMRGVDLKTPAPAASSSSTVTVPKSGTISISGHGYGHGIGMSQYGAEGAARKGMDHTDILKHYYPGTSLSTRSGNIRVLISAQTSDATIVTGQSGLRFYDISAKRWTNLPTSMSGATVKRWQMVPYSSGSSRSKLRYQTTGGYVTYRDSKGALLSWTGDGQFYASSPVSLVLPGGGTMKLRGYVRSAKPSAGSGKRDTVNSLPVDDYVRGVIAAEMPASWHPEALQSQAVAARTYGVRSINGSRHYDICSTTACQVYGGSSRETSSTDAAVRATARQILTYRGVPAFTQFSSSSGGYSAVGSQPYLKAVSDPYDGWSGNKNHAWKVSVKASTIQRANPSIGSLRKMTITKRNGHGAFGGRVEAVTLYGSARTVSISGNDARWGFGLKSNWFAF